MFEVSFELFDQRDKRDLGSYPETSSAEIMDDIRQGVKDSTKCITLPRVPEIGEFVTLPNGRMGQVDFIHTVIPTSTVAPHYRIHLMV